MLNKFPHTIIISIAFFLLALFTLPHYGINWDTINHLPRGQGYLHYFLTGNRDYSDMPRWFSYYQDPQSLTINTDIPLTPESRRSIYQNQVIDFNWLIINDGNGHPPLSGILSSLFNFVLFQQLGLINDIDSYRVYGVFLSACLVGLVYWWTKKVYGRFAGLIATLSLAVYPLFFSELHFNTEKDLPETVYWSFLMFAVWKGVSTKSWKWILVSGIFFGLALGTKFNVLFSVLIILPWLAVYLISIWREKKVKLFEALKSNSKIILACLAAPVIGLGLFFVFWPYLWFSGLNGLILVLNFYQTIGTTTSTDSSFIWHFGINLYPLKWIIYTTPEVILILFALGIGFVIANLNKRRDKVALLFLLWLIVPIIRVSLPNTNIYGGIRQIMEFIPALAILTGAGAGYLFSFVAKKTSYATIASLIIILSFIPIIITLIKIHPNENVYFNSLIGGLEGAKQQNIPGWGNSFGAAYRQAFVWVNNNAEKGATVGFAYELMPNFPEIFVRRDLKLDNHSRSGSARWGEYAVTLTHQGSQNRSYYDNYLENFLNPVYQSGIDGVAVVKVWKNDLAHIKVGFSKEQELIPEVLSTKNGFRLDLGGNYYLSRVEGTFGDKNCKKLSSAFASVSEDGIVFRRLVGTMPNEDWNVEVYGKQPKVNSFIQPFAADKARYINYSIDPVDACLNNISSIKVFYLTDLGN